MSETRTIDIPAGSRVSENVQGSVFSCISAGADFVVVTNRGQTFFTGAGRGFGGPNQQEFSRLTFTNLTANAIQVVYYAGNESFVPSQTNIAAPNVTVGTTAASSYTKGRGLVALADGASSAAYNGLDAAKVRKQFVVRNQSTSVGNLQIKDAGGNIMDVLAPGDPAWTMETNGSFILTANGGAVTYTVAETFYS